MQARKILFIGSSLTAAGVARVMLNLAEDWHLVILGDGKLRPGKDGLLVPQNDPAALTAGLDRLLQDETLRQQLGKQAIEVVQRFSPQQIRAMWRGLFDELLGQRRHGMGVA